MPATQQLQQALQQVVQRLQQAVQQQGGAPVLLAIALATLLSLYMLSGLFAGSSVRRRSGKATAVVHSIGTANPPRTVTSEDFLGIVATLDYPPKIAETMGKVVAGSGIQRRFCVSSTPVPQYTAALNVEGARSALWEACVPTMAVAAARDALSRWRHGTTADITHVVVHSCTGFSAPGLDFELIVALGLNSSTRKIGVNFMGCFGGMTSLYVAKQLVEADETGKAVVLVVCAEACTVHICADAKVQLAVGNSLFGDGAGAAIVTHAGFRGSTPPPPPAAAAAAGSAAAPPIFSLESDHHEWSMGPFASEIVPNSAGHMTWKQSKQGGRYDMWLAKEIPEALLGFFSANSLSLLPRVGILNPYSCAWAIHPGGKGILRSLETALGALGIKPTGIDASHSVLENYGNMSSATIFFVLQRVLSATTKDCAFVAAFGPGLTVEFGSFHRVKAERG